MIIKRYDLTDFSKQIKKYRNKKGFLEVDRIKSFQRIVEGKVNYIMVEQQQRKFNEIYDDKIIKYTINLPIELYGQITQRARKSKVHRSVLIRKVLEYACDHEQPISAKELVNYVRGAIHYPEQPHNPPHKYHGFLGGLQRNSFVLSWFRKRKGNN